MKIAIGSDHGGFEDKEIVKKHLEEKGYEVIDCGTFSKESCNYPTYALNTAEKVKNKEADKGILICNSGEGVAISANKVKGIRCGIGYNNDVAHLVVKHNNCNMIAFGAHFFSVEQIMEMVDIFLSSKFEGGRHEIRVNIISDYEDKHGL